MRLYLEILDDDLAWFSLISEPYLLIMEYVMYGKLLQHLRDQRSRQTNFFQFSDTEQTTDNESDTLNSKDLTKYAYGVAKGMEFIVSKGVSGERKKNLLNGTNIIVRILISANPFPARLSTVTWRPATS